MLKILNISVKHSQTGSAMRLALSLLILTLLAGCFANYGKYNRSGDVAKIFESLQVPSEYIYYYAGSYKNPDALMGLHRDYTLSNDLWQKTEMDSKELRIWIDEMNLTGFSSAYGRYILDPADKIIGIYYSKWAGGPVKIKSGNQVVVHLPDTHRGRRPHLLMRNDF